MKNNCDNLFASFYRIHYSVWHSNYFMFCSYNMFKHACITWKVAWHITIKFLLNSLLYKMIRKVHKIKLPSSSQISVVIFFAQLTIQKPRIWIIIQKNNAYIRLTNGTGLDIKWISKCWIFCEVCQLWNAWLGNKGILAVKFFKYPHNSIDEVYF